MKGASLGYLLMGGNPPAYIFFFEEVIVPYFD